MKRTIVKFGAAAFLVGMFAIMPGCKEKAAAETTEETAVTETTEAAAEEATMAVDDTDTTGGKEIKTGSDPVKQ
jgi:hypothetical protein